MQRCRTESRQLRAALSLAAEPNRAEPSGGGWPGWGRTAARCSPGPAAPPRPRGDGAAAKQGQRDRRALGAGRGGDGGCKRGGGLMGGGC